MLLDSLIGWNGSGFKCAGLLKDRFLESGRLHRDPEDSKEPPERARHPGRSRRKVAQQDRARVLAAAQRGHHLAVGHAGVFRLSDTSDIVMRDITGGHSKNLFGTNRNAFRMNSRATTWCLAMRATSGLHFQVSASSISCGLLVTQASDSEIVDGIESDSWIEIRDRRSN